VRVRKEMLGSCGVWFAMSREMLHLVDIEAVDPLELGSLVQTTLRAFVPVFGPLQMTDLIGHDTLRDISNPLYPQLAAMQQHHGLSNRSLPMGARGDERARIL
jgi:3-hydroxyacyl-CoA dehydrogenase